jgi:hypothetical protein
MFCFLFHHHSIKISCLLSSLVLHSFLTMATVTTTPTITGRLVRKRKRQNRVILAIRAREGEDDEIDTSVSIDRNHSYEFLFLDAIVQVDCCQQEEDQQPHQEDQRLQQGFLTANSISLIQCAPDPNTVSLVLEGILKDKFSLATLPGLRDKQHAVQILALGPRERRLAIAKLVRALEGKHTDKTSRNRVPHTKRCDLELLHEMEGLGRSGQAGWTLMEPVRKVVPVQQHEAKVIPLNIPGQDVMSCRGEQSRADYILSKKLPQVRWMIQRVHELPQRPKHIVDVGGGRGDLATGLALAYPDSIITVVDKNLSSLDAGRDYAVQLSCSDRVHFCHADFSHFVQDPPTFLSSDLPPVDLVVGLHTCGDLSDLALTYAKAAGAGFVVCPCCYAKRYIPNFVPSWNSYCLEAHDTLGRLAELNERPTVSRTAMSVINSMRLQSMTDYKVCLEEYESTSSLRNCVLVGVYLPAKTAI